jgi:hypothetical protein
LKNEEHLSPYILALYFAYHNRSKNECEEIEFPSHKWESQIAKYRSKMLTSTQLPTIELGNVSNSFNYLMDFLENLKWLNLIYRILSICGACATIFQSF